jgi:hypothetical protein
MFFLQKIQRKVIIKIKFEKEKKFNYLSLSCFSFFFIKHIQKSSSFKNIESID